MGLKLIRFRYHWAFITGPKSESVDSWGERFHVKQILELTDNPPSVKPRWRFEVIETPMTASSMILVRILIGKVKDMDRLRSSLQRAPLRPKIPNWNWIEWAREAFELIQKDEVLGTHIASWESIRATAMWYVNAKKSIHRFDGTVKYDWTKVPTWDMLQGVEIVS